MAALLLLNRVSRTTSSNSIHRVAGALGFNSLNAQIHGDRISGTLFRVRSLATLAEGASRFDEMVSVNQRKFYLLGGKGGVGKTSCAASLAVKFASHGHPTIVVSTDPAHSLSDSFSQDLSGGVLKPVQGVDSPLLALEITPEIMKDEIKRQTGDKSVKNMMDSMGLGMFAGELGDLNLEDMLNAASPGIDEIAAISKVLQFMEAPEYSRFTRIVFDTAPTGHTLRLLSLPDFYDSSISKITKLKKKITAAASAFKSVFGKKEIQQQELPNELDQLKERMEKVRNVFRDVNTTEFVIVTIPTVMAINESSRLHASLRKENVPVHRLIVNQLLPQSDSDCKFCSMRRKEQTRVLGLIQNDAELSGLKLIQSPLLDAEIRGVPALKFMGDLIWK
ncbi:Arsenical pump ATPase ArsA/GET3 [Arabidopsis thaliana x Arabidopsis arenosa]|uniref:Arsenical pump ATPase ArsA/GET3 n=2 Tax=Arabidopsis thaliana x Arabidopsis arenosa TaxID=1240361 RepID=A0A8T1XT89_9BRAS|nr:Arsenical pump ATPase ArsA/GET3 [Arabidopsis thaliana x Arabidopsis arenosa]